MEAKRIYPSVNEGILKQIRNMAEEFPDYFTHPSCPYQQSTKDLFVKPSKVDLGSEIDEEFDANLTELPDTDQMVLRINNLMKKLERFGNEAESGAEKNTYFRLSTTLLTQLVELKSKITLLGQHEAFVAEIMAILEQVCDADQRNEVTDRLRKFSEGMKNE